jgi:pimeloyl-ACP methyl ester carboxylesterase
VDIGGRRIQIDCRGLGSPTVVFESGLDALGSLSWAAVHDSVAKTTRACAYSRAGIMWSDRSSALFSNVSVAKDLHAALVAAGESGPFVMVAHSLGGPYVMTFTALFGSDVAGVVLVDASHPDQIARLEKATGLTMTPGTGALAFGSAVVRTGLVRMLAGDVAPPRAPRYVHRAAAAYTPPSVASLLREASAVPLSFAEGGRSRDLGDRPLLVLTAMAQLTDAELKMQHLTRAQANAFRVEWKDLQRDESTWSRRGRQILVPNATHFIQFDQPNIVITAVRDVVFAVRQCRSTA